MIAWLPKMFLQDLLHLTKVLILIFLKDGRVWTELNNYWLYEVHALWLMIIGWWFMVDINGWQYVVDDKSLLGVVFQPTRQVAARGEAQEPKTTRWEFFCLFSLVRVFGFFLGFGLLPLFFGESFRILFDVFFLWWKLSKFSLRVNNIFLLLGSVGGDAGSGTASTSSMLGSILSSFPLSSPFVSQ